MSKRSGVGLLEPFSPTVLSLRLREGALCALTSRAHIRHVAKAVRARYLVEAAAVETDDWSLFKRMHVVLCGPSS